MSETTAKIYKVPLEVLDKTSPKPIPFSSALCPIIYVNLFSMNKKIYDRPRSRVVSVLSRLYLDVPPRLSRAESELHSIAFGCKVVFLFTARSKPSV